MTLLHRCCKRCEHIAHCLHANNRKKKFTVKLREEHNKRALRWSDHMLRWHRLQPFCQTTPSPVSRSRISKQVAAQSAPHNFVIQSWWSEFKA